jgi:transposase
MTDQRQELPDDVAALKALLIAERALNQRLERLIAELRRMHFGRRSEKLDPDQMDLGLEDVEAAIAETRAEAEQTGLKTPPERRKRTVNRGALPRHLPREDVVIEPETTTCSCGACMQRIGEDRSERLDVIPARFKVIVTIRPKYACRACQEGVVQAPAPARLIEGGIPTEAMVAHVLVDKYANHLPLYRQAQMLARQGIDLDRSTLADWVGRAAFELRPVFEHLVADIKTSTKLFMDETPVPVLDPGRGKTKTGYLWALARDDRPWSGSDPPAIAYCYAPGRGGDHAERFLEGFSGTLQVDGYAAYNRLTGKHRKDGMIVLAYCWAHARRKLYDSAQSGSPVAEEGLVRIARLYAIEKEIRGSSPTDRRDVRQQRSAPLVEAFEQWLDVQRARISAKSRLGEALGYIARHRSGLRLFLEDGRIEIDSNVVERSVRPIALNRKNALFAGHDEGAANWGTIASLIETCKLNGVEPHGYLTEVLERIVHGHPQSRVGELMPWSCRAQNVKTAA